jgi:hypothetical protein
MVDRVPVSKPFGARLFGQRFFWTTTVVQAVHASGNSVFS